MSDKTIVIAGYSGHGFVVADAALNSGIELTHYSDLDMNKINPFNFKYLGAENENDFFISNPNLEYILGIGNNRIRRKVYELLRSNSVKVINVIHSTACISQHVTMGDGNFISKNVAINPMVRIGDACIINTGAIIEHECVIGNLSHIAPGAVLAGNVSIGQGSFIGANSVIKEGVSIGDNAIIGAGSVVLKNIGDNQKVAGNPARMI